MLDSFTATITRVTSSPISESTRFNSLQLASLSPSTLTSRLYWTTTEAPAWLTTPAQGSQFLSDFAKLRADPTSNTVRRFLVRVIVGPESWATSRAVLSFIPGPGPETSRTEQNDNFHKITCKELKGDKFFMFFHKILPPFNF